MCKLYFLPDSGSWISVWHQPFAANRCCEEGIHQRGAEIPGLGETCIILKAKIHHSQPRYFKSYLLSEFLFFTKMNVLSSIYNYVSSDLGMATPARRVLLAVCFWNSVSWYDRSSLCDLCWGNTGCFTQWNIAPINLGLTRSPNRSNYCRYRRADFL